MDFLHGLSGTFLSIVCQEHKPQRPLNIEDRPAIPLPRAHLEGIIGEIKTRGDFTHEAWVECLIALEALRSEHEPNVFQVLDAVDAAYREVVGDLKEISELQRDANEDMSILLRPELDVGVIDDFCKTLVEADKTLVGIATDENDEAVPRHMGVGKLHEVLAHLETFLETQRNAGIVFMMILEIVKLQQVVEDNGEGKWLQPLEETLDDALYEQIAQAGPSSHAAAAAPAPATARSDLASAVESALAPQPELVPAADPQDGDESETDSAVGDDAASSTASITSSILEYRTIQGRTFHSDRHPTEYFTPNDEQQSASIDINHHALTQLLSGRLFLAPIKDNVQKVLDVGTGTGIWAIDFADEYPEAEVIGSDLSPIQPNWAPPNVKFEIDDATLRWTWDNNTFDFIHIRYLFGAIKDWSSLFKEAYRCCAPDGWIQSAEADVHIRSDDGTTDDLDCLKLWAKLFTEGGAALGSPFFVQEGDLQEKGIHAAGFTDIKSIEYKFPIGGWPRDPELASVGNYVRATLENDIEGYTLLLWKTILQWPEDEYQVFLMEMRKFLKNKKVHAYMTVHYVYGHKAEAS
ncbi:TAM domain methyltransferase [Fusarium agapanthi]|uniref:TAM domain methyltransferase n=1 Tax=Fusarium agapanthi TaxID=1803897 RepID=A0A9P5B4V0_9HYPO|nr:TAM domain methyltransferase [Fusarium agapanthi]